MAYNRSSPLIVFLFSFLHFSHASEVINEINLIIILKINYSETHSYTVSFASLAILAFSGKAFFIILFILAIGRNLL